MSTAGTRDGYTLVELLVVIAVIGLIVTVAAPVASNSIASGQFRADGENIITVLHRCRTDAVQQQHTIALHTPGDVIDLAKSNGLTVTPEISLQIVEPIRCFADGTTTGGRLVLKRGARSQSISVSWLTGAVAVE